MNIWLEATRFFQTYAIELTAAAVLLLILIVIRRSDSSALFWLRLRVHFPVFGLLARLSGQLRHDASSGWFRAEQALCRAYHAHAVDAAREIDAYDQSVSYLRKCQELGRQRLSVMGWSVIAVMVFLEAIGFSYVLAGYTLPGASEALKQQGAVGIAFLVSILLVFMTHYSGHELHHNDLVNMIRTWFRQSGASKEQLEPNTQVSLANDDADNHEPAWCQLLNRLPTNADIKPTYRVTAATLIMVVLIAVGATYVRGQVLEQDKLDQQRVGSAMVMPVTDPYAEQLLPAELENEQRIIDQRLDEESRLADLKAGWATFLVLAVIFVFLQLLSVIMGYRTGFAAREAAIARSTVGRFRTRQQFLAHLERKQIRVMTAAQAALEQLQASMLKRAEADGLSQAELQTLQSSGERTFQAWLDGERAPRPAVQATETPASPVPRDRTALQIVQAAASDRQAANQAAPLDFSSEQASDSNVLDEAEVRAWMDRFGWSRERTVAALLKHRSRHYSQFDESAVSEDAAMRILQLDASSRASHTSYKWRPRS